MTRLSAWWQARRDALTTLAVTLGLIDGDVP